jgi:murein lipoprotein
MHLKFTRTAAIGLIAAASLLLTQSACTTRPVLAPQASATDPKTPPEISAEAKTALALAEAEVAAAKAKFALWTTAAAALASARAAAQTGDSATVIRHAQFAAEQARLGLAQLDNAQLNTPSTEKK